MMRPFPLRRWTLAVFVCAWGLALTPVDALAQATAMPTSARDKTFWQAVAKNKFAVPADVPLPVMLDELSALLASPDPELRDDLAYSTLTSWIYSQRVVPVDERLRLLRAWEGRLTSGIGERDTPTVVGRSFSVLAIGLLVILDNEAAYLDRETFARLLSSTLSYLRDERDVRGFDARLGWLHSVAHTADVIKFLARSRHLRVDEQARLLTAIHDKLLSVETPLTHGEDERLARAVLSITARQDFDDVAFAAWLTSMSPVRRSTPPTLVSLAIDQNRKNVLVSLFTVLSTDRRDLPGNVRARAMVLETLMRFM